MTTQDHVDNFIRANPGAKYSTIVKFCVEHYGDKANTVEGAVKRFKKRHPQLYHPGETQTEYNFRIASIKIDIHEGEDEIVEPVVPEKGVGFFVFVEKFGYPRYGSLFKFQEEIYRIVHEPKWVMINLPRDHGKSIFLGFYSEWMMENGWDILYLGWTDRRKEIAEFIFMYFVTRGTLYTGKNVTNSAFHFQIESGCRFDTYSITDRKILGKHALGKTIDQKERKLLLIIDDPIDETFREERHKEYKLETKWRSTISNINPNKIIFTGTKKFEEDFFYYIKRTYSEKHGLVHYYRRTHLCTPHIRDLSEFWGDLNHKRDFYELPTNEQNLMLDRARSNPCYNPDLAFPDLRFIPGKPPEENLLCPEKWTEEALNLKREEVTEYWWHSEYEQNPHPITGEVWEELKYIKTLDSWKAYDMGMIVVDAVTASDAKKAGTPAEKKLKATAYTGLVIILRHAPTGDFHVAFDLTGDYNFEERMELIESYFRMLRHKNYNMKVKVAIERQGGGSDIINSALARREYTFGVHCVEINQRRDKIMRIDDYLRVPINKGKIKFLFNLRHSELVNEILNFPYSNKLDAIDALATGIHEYENHVLGLSKDQIEQLVDELKGRRQARWEADWTRRMETPWVKKTSARSRVRRFMG